ncbi:peptidase M14 [Bacillus methanolicus]|uniref:M14 family metallopeptidase n=1 Tax=Bacillus methanolicus TaxID=1471 RepID=UPI00238069A4|nr:M14 family metallopeptidase [Bacillus methanolicus]MDE3839590.1 peptidase M14 [Bacillus methanolicus]
MKVRVRSGDSFWYYSQLFQIPLNLITDSNPDLNPANLQVGQEIQIPGYIDKFYSIKRGDTFWKLSAIGNMSVDALMLLNQNVNPNQLKAGENILLPVRVTSPIVNGKREYDYHVLQDDLNQLKKIYPFININSVGKSVLGLPIQEIRLGNGPKKVQMNASFHANEWITTSILMSYLNTYLLSLTNSSLIRGISTLPLYNSVELTLIPMVNPDGVNLVLNGPPGEFRESVIKMNNGSTDFNDWKANIRGIDLNNQYLAKWEIEKERKKPKAPSPRDYPGDAPLTEPEAIAMENLARSLPFDRMLAFHTQGKEFYWGYEGFEPPESKRLADEFERVSGYKAVCYIDSHAGYRDWFIQEFRRPGFTIELGKGVNPLPLSQFDEIYEDVLGIFLASLYM